MKIRKIQNNLTQVFYKYYNISWSKGNQTMALGQLREYN